MNVEELTEKTKEKLFKLESMKAELNKFEEEVTNELNFYSYESQDIIFTLHMYHMYQKHNFYEIKNINDYEVIVKLITQRNDKYCYSLKKQLNRLFAEDTFIIDNMCNLTFDSIRINHCYQIEKIRIHWRKIFSLLNESNIKKFHQTVCDFVKLNDNLKNNYFIQDMLINTHIDEKIKKLFDTDNTELARKLILSQYLT